MSGPKFSLSFTKTIEKKNLQPSAIRNDIPLEVKDKTEALESIEENVLKTDGKAAEPELVIPMVASDRLSILRRIAEKSLKIDDQLEEDGEKSVKAGEDNKQNIPMENKVLTLDEQAEAAILEESKKRLEEWTERSVPDNLIISQDGNEEDKEEKASAAKESSLDDYDQVDISVFGAALLRGMGWQKSEGIGRMGKRVVEVIDPSSKTFGLGRNSNETGKKDNVAGAEEELHLAKGSFIFIHSGRRRGTYGIVESLDEDHLLVKSAVGQDIIREVELNIRVVSQKEYKDSSRVINKDMFDKYKEEEEARKTKKKKNTTSHSSDNSDIVEVKEIKKEETSSRNEQKGEKSSLEERARTPSTKEKPESPEKKDFENIKYNKDERTKSDTKRQQIDDYLHAKHEKERQSEKWEVQDSIPEQSRGSKLEMHEDRTRYEEKYRYDRKYKSEKCRYEKDDKYKDKFRSSQQDKDETKSRDYVEKHQKSYVECSEEKHSKKYKSISENKSQKRREDSDVYSQDYKKAKKTQEQLPAMPWVRENLRVRLISKDYKGGRYHKEKVIVKVVETAESCECITEDGRLLREVHPGWLETVIPKVEPRNILIVKGRQKGQRGRILQLHKDQEKASVQLMEDNTEILKLHYDDICEYVSRY